MAGRLPLCPAWKAQNGQFNFIDDFEYYTTAHRFTTVASDSGTVAHSDAVGGILVISPSDGTVTNNDESYVKSTTEFAKFNSKGFVAEGLLKWTEANTDDANIAFGLADAVAANLIVDDGAGLKTSGSIAAIYKVDGGLVWKCVTSIGSTQTISTSTTLSTSTSYQRLTIEYVPKSSTVGEVLFYVDGVQLFDSNNQPIVHSVTFASATEMQLFAGSKNGADSGHEILYVDYLAFTAVRP